MKISRKIVLTLAAAVIGLGLTSAPAHADSSWGCGGLCRVDTPGR